MFQLKRSFLSSPAMFQLAPHIFQLNVHFLSSPAHFSLSPHICLIEATFIDEPRPLFDYTVIFKLDPPILK